MGWGLVDEQSGRLSHVEHGALKTPSGMPPAQRLQLLYEGIADLLRQYKPDDTAIEELFFGKNVNTALSVGQARGVVLLALAQANLPIHEYKPLAVKQSVAGYGGADKRQMQEMVRMTLNLSAMPRPDDAADALAVAICHAYSAPMLRRIKETG
jgi:crossover junction endodeoxyribonuclease RuvC